MQTLLIALMLVQVSPADATDYGRYNRLTQYDSHFSKYSKRYFGAGFDWRYFKAQAIAESSLRPDARSSQGARGSCRSCRPRLKRSGNVTVGSQARSTSRAGISRLAFGTTVRTFRCGRRIGRFLKRLKFMFGSYNAGRGSILRAQREALRNGLNGTLWSSIERHLPNVTGRHSKETLTYVSRIMSIKGSLR